MNVSILTQLMLTQLVDATALSKKDFKAWISARAYWVEDIHSKSHFTLRVRDVKGFGEMLAFDSARMASASMETAHGAISAEFMPKSTAWAAIRLYYAAFFSAHSIMRMFGCICSQLEKGHIRLVNELAELQGKDPILNESSAYFYGEYFSSSGNIELQKLSDTHRDTWVYFVRFLKRLSKDVLLIRFALKDDKEELSAFLDDIAYSISHNGSGGENYWLSTFRNNINYRHEYGAWFPFSKDSIVLEDVASISRLCFSENWPAPVDLKVGVDMRRFLYVTSTLVKLCRELVFVIKDSRNSEKKSHFENRPLAFINLANV